MVAVLISIAGGATLYGVRCDRRAERVARRILAHLHEHRPEAADAIPRFYRRFARATVQIRILRMNGSTLLPAEDLDELKRLERHTLVAMLVGLGTVIMTLVGSHIFHWSWG